MTVDLGSRAIRLTPDAEAPHPVRVVIADPDPLARRAVRDAFGAIVSIEVVGDVSSGATLLEVTRAEEPAIVLCEASLGDMTAVEAIRRLREEAPDVRVVVFTVQADEDLALAALRAGACGILPKSTAAEQLARALVGVTTGEAAISRRLTMRLVECVRSVPAGLAGMRPIKSSLSPREWEVLDHIAGGASTEEVARRLVLTEDTVYSHLKSIMRKLGVHTRSDAVAAAERLRWPSSIERS